MYCGEYMPQYKGCPECWTVVLLSNNIQTCLHQLKENRYRQEGAKFYRQNRDNVTASHFKIPVWMFPNTRRTVAEDSVDTTIMAPIMEFLRELYPKVDPTIDDGNASETECGSTDSEGIDPQLEDWGMFRQEMRRRDAQKEKEEEEREEG